METVVIGCKLPHGLVLEHNGVKVVLAGGNASPLVGGNTGYTIIDKDLWEAWEKDHKAFNPYANGAIFVAKNMESAQKIAENRSKLDTGLAPIEPDALGVTPANDDI